MKSKIETLEQLENITEFAFELIGDEIYPKERS